MERKGSGNMSYIDSTWLHTIRGADNGESVLQNVGLTGLIETLVDVCPLLAFEWNSKEAADVIQLKADVINVLVRCEMHNPKRVSHRTLLSIVRCPRSNLHVEHDLILHES